MRADAAEAVRDARRRAAAWLRRVRANGDDRRHAAEQAVRAAPSSGSARCLHVRVLLDEGRIEHAEAAIAEALLHRPTDPRLAMLLGVVHRRQDRLEEAALEFDLSLAARPDHGGTLALAGDTAWQRGDVAGAADLLERAVRRHPTHAGYRDTLIDCLITAGQFERAASALEAPGERGPLVTGRTLDRDGRADAAAGVLESAIERAEDDDVRERLLLELLPVLERLDDPARLRATIDRAPARPASRVRCARADLCLAEFDRAARAAAAHLDDPSVGDHALHVLVVASALAGRTSLARRALKRLEVRPDGVDAILMADCWRRGLAGRTPPGDRASAGDDAPRGVLRSMVRHARRVFDQALADGVADPAEEQELARHRAVCMAVLAQDAGAADPMRV